MTATLTNPQLVQQWCKVTLERFNESIDKLHIGVTGTLRSSIISHIITGSGGNVALIELKFQYYGRYVDMGVGRGVPIGGRISNADFYSFRNDKGQLHSYNRTRKNWYSTNKTREVHRLNELMAEHFGIRSLDIAESKLGTLEVKLDA